CRAVERAAPRRTAGGRQAGAGQHDRGLVHHLPCERTHRAVQRRRARGAHRARCDLPQGRLDAPGRGNHALPPAARPQRRAAVRALSRRRWRAPRAAAAADRGWRRRRDPFDV
ncbi:MAG: Cytochrome c-type biogenesis protein DsbD, protein-disulfide reductase, partial [uncultured Lysobacter sp.]